MAQTEFWMKTDLNQNVSVRSIKGNFFSQDNNGNIIGVVVVKGGAPETLTGNVYGYIIRPDGATVVVEGTASENRASIQIPSQALAYTGRIDIVIQLASSSVRTVLGACSGTVVQSRTDATVDPGEIIPDLSELLAKIADCVAATTAANTAATNANTKAGLADTAASNANTKAGLADTAATSANSAASAANTAAGKINDMTVAAQTLAEGASATATISEVSGHKHILFGIPKGDTGEIDIDDTAGAGDTDKAWSADKNVTEFAKKADKTDTVLDTTLSRGRTGTAGTGSVAFGYSAKASGQYSQAVGTSTVASGANGHAEGNTTKAYGQSSHAEGYGTQAVGDYSHAEGNQTYARHKSQHVFGEFNVWDLGETETYERGEFVEIVGNGETDIAPSNARALDWDGNEYLAGDVRVNCNDDSSGGMALGAVLSGLIGALASAGLVIYNGQFYINPDGNSLSA